MAIDATAEKLRQRARDKRAEAQHFLYPEVRDQLIAAAVEYERLAKLAEMVAVRQGIDAESGHD
jgi:hypothetical protein